MSEYWKISTQRQRIFSVFDPVTGLPVSSLVQGDFAITLLLNTAVPGSPPTVVIANLGSGRYSVTWTPGTLGYWYMSIRNATYNMQGWKDEIDVVSVGFGELTAATIMSIAMALITLPESAFEVAIRGVRCLGNVVQRIRNQVLRTTPPVAAVTPQIFTVYESDNLTVAWTSNTQTDPMQTPVVSETPS